MTYQLLARTPLGENTTTKLVYKDYEIKIGEIVLLVYLVHFPFKGYDVVLGIE